MAKKKKRAHFSSLLKLLQCNCFVLCFVLLSSTTALQEVVVEASGNVVYKKVASAMPILAGESLLLSLVSCCDSADYVTGTVSSRRRERLQSDKLFHRGRHQQPEWTRPRHTACPHHAGLHQGQTLPAGEAKRCVSAADANCTEIFDWMS